MAGKEDGECRECDSIAKIMEGGVCKAEFMKFDACMDNALIQKTDDSACEKMFDVFRECIRKREAISSIMRSAAGSNR